MYSGRQKKSESGFWTLLMSRFNPSSHGAHTHFTAQIFTAAFFFLSKIYVQGIMAA